MPLDSAESFEAALLSLGIGRAIFEAAAQMPPPTPERPRKAIDFAPILQILQEKVLPLVDQVVEDVND